jgi:hypothetical protein
VEHLQRNLEEHLKANVHKDIGTQEKLKYSIKLEILLFLFKELVILVCHEETDNNVT